MFVADNDNAASSRAAIIGGYVTIVSFQRLNNGTWSVIAKLFETGVRRLIPRAMKMLVGTGLAMPDAWLNYEPRKPENMPYFGERTQQKPLKPAFRLLSGGADN